MSDPLLRAYLKGSAPGADKLIRLAVALGVRLDWLATGKGPMLAETALQAAFGNRALVLVPLFDVQVAAGAGAFDWRPEGEPVARIEVTMEAVRAQMQTRPEALVAVPITGRSMEPMYRDGEVALIDRNRTEVPAAGGFFLLRTPEGLRIKQVRRDGKHLVLASINAAEFPPEQLDVETALRIQILGRVAGTMPDPRRARIDPAP
jgi:phage repressor protein C with HTH and peptisase S24 domain